MFVVGIARSFLIKMMFHCTSEVALVVFGPSCYSQPLDRENGEGFDETG